MESLDELRPEKDQDVECTPQHWPQKKLQRKECREQLKSALMTRHQLLEDVEPELEAEPKAPLHDENDESVRRWKASILNTSFGDN